MFHSTPSRALHGLLIVAMLVFANACARGGGDCIPAGKCGEESVRRLSSQPEEKAHCPDEDGCDSHPTAPCNHSSVCCSTWAPAKTWVSLDRPVHGNPAEIVSSMESLVPL